MKLVDFEQVIFSQCHLDLRKPIILGLSGGADSLCLFDLFKRLGFKLVVAHFDHQLRPGSEEDAEYVKRIASQAGYPFILGQEDISSVAKKMKLTIEEAARQVRYRFLFDQARRFDVQAVATAHSADDQVETVLMHFLRGSALNGLTGMKIKLINPEWDTNIPLIRPLLGFWREEILEYCHQMDLKPVQDPSNFDTTYFRNRIRHELIPYLQKYNSQVKNAIFRLANNLDGDAQIVQEVVEESWKETCKYVGEDTIALDLKSLLESNIPVQRYVFHRALSQIAEGKTEIGFDHVQQSIEFLLYSENYAKLSVVGGINLFRELDALIVSRGDHRYDLNHFPQLSADIKIHSQGVWRLNNHWQLAIMFSEGDQPVRVIDTADRFDALVDADRIKYPLTVRSRLPGDRFKPFGMHGQSMKIADFFINEKLPEEARHAYPLICTKNEIIWLPGYRISHGYQVEPTTRRVLHMKLIKD